MRKSWRSCAHTLDSMTLSLSNIVFVRMHYCDLCHQESFFLCSYYAFFVISLLTKELLYLANVYVDATTSSLILIIYGQLHVNFLCCFVLGCGLIYYEGQKLKGNKLYTVSKIPLMENMKAARVFS